MQKLLNKFVSSTLGATAASLVLLAATSYGVNFAGNLNNDFGGPVGNGVLSVTDDGTNLTFNLQRGVSGNLNDCLVIYVDTGTGGFTNTASFTDTSGYEQRGISGYDGSSRSVMTFTNGFRPKYAVAIKPDWMDIWSLANPGSFSYLSGASQSGSSSAYFTLTFNCANLGLATNVPATIRIFGTLINPNGAYRSTEAIAGNCFSLAGKGPWPFTNTAYGTYSFAAPPPPTYAVNFSVDMTAQVASGAFNTSGGDTVYCGGTFQSTPFTFNSFQLTNSPANTNIFQGTYLDSNPTNSLETYKFKFTHITLTSTNDVYDDNPNRSFVLTGNGQIVPRVYFNNVAATPSATTNHITFSIDMGPQIYRGNFDSALETIQVFGTFQSPKFSGGYILTNNPSSAQSNIFSGTFTDYNYPGSQQYYKFVIVTNGGLNLYESGSDRMLVTPTNSGALPLAYFSGITTYGAVPITFLVDMTIPIIAGQFDPGAGDVVCAAGTFQTNQWTPGVFVLTNAPGANSNIFSGTYLDGNSPNSGEVYKFVMVTNLSNLGTNWENNDRNFILGSTALTNPVVFWNNLSTNKVVMVPTTIVFRVLVTNGTPDKYGNPFDHDTDLVFINGNFTSPPWIDNVGTAGFWQDPFINTDYAQLILTENPAGSFIYSNSFVLPAGSSRLIDYKYGIRFPNVVSGVDLNTNVDNESPSGNDHHRYVRGTGTYTFPVDTFGGPLQSNGNAATEPVMGNLAVGKLTAGKVPISWLGGLPGVRLQVSTNLANPAAWQDITNSDGSSQTNWPVGGGNYYFRLHNTVW
jgi:hypothetical protein